MTNYRRFDVLDFVQDEAFQRWVEGNASPTEEAFWRQWTHENPERQPLLDRAALTIRTLTVQELALPTGAVRHEVQRILTRIQEEPVVRPMPQSRRLWWAAAAAVALMLVLSGWYAFQMKLTQSPVAGRAVYDMSVAEASVPLIERRNTSAVAIAIALPDQSEVTLEPGGRLSYPTRFAPDNRTVYLSGDAFFTVTPNARKPFLVFANETVTKVLGTSFRVSAQPQAAQVTVQVRTGLVTVMPKAGFSKAELGTLKTTNGMLITPNQQVVFEREAETMHRSIVDKPILLLKAPESTSMTFKDAPLVDVLAALERAYGIDLVYNADDLRNCTLRASLYDETLFDKLALICKTVGLSYQIIDTQVVITGRGCGM